MPEYGMGYEPFDYNTFLADYYDYLVSLEKVYVGDKTSAEEVLISAFSDDHLRNMVMSEIPDITRISYGNAYDSMRAHSRRQRLVNMNRSDFFERAVTASTFKRASIIKRQARINRDLSEVMSDRILGELRPDIWAKIKDEFDVAVKKKKGLETEIRAIGIPDDVKLTMNHIIDYMRYKERIK